MPGTTISLTAASPPAPESASSPRRTQITAFDLVERLLSSLGGDASRPAHNDIRRAIVDAYRELVNVHNWTYLVSMGRLFLQPAQTTGTITYDHTGGAYERLLTLAGATWPSWAEQGYVRIGDVVSWVKYRIDDTRLQLEEVDNPGQDIAAGTSYEIDQDTYELPEDFIASASPSPEANWGSMTYMSPAEYLQTLRYLASPGGQPRFYTFTGSRKAPGRLVLRIHPAPSTFETLDFSYKRKCRDIQVWDAHDGKATISGGSSTVTLANGGAFTPRMAGSTIRFSDTVEPPTPLEGSNPFVEERQIDQVLSASQATLDGPVVNTYTSMGYTISDPLDIESQSMFNALYAGAMRHLAFARQYKPGEYDDAQKNWLFMLRLAKEADVRDASVRRVSLHGPYRQPMRYMPLGGDE